MQGKLVRSPDDQPQPYLLASFVRDGGEDRDIRSLSRLVTGFEPHLSFDYLPISPAQVKLFVLTNVKNVYKRKVKEGDLSGRISDPDDPAFKEPNWSFRVHEYHARWEAKEKDWEEGEWSKETEELPIVFRTPFRVAARGDTWFFLTDDGKVYRARKAEKGKQRTIEPLWDKPEHPVFAHLHDADSDRTFVFCRKAGDDGKDAWFELTDDKPQLKSFDPKKLKTADLKEPIKTLWQLGNLLRDEGVVQVK
jgi:hypothetical protein